MYILLNFAGLLARLLEFYHDEDMVVPEEEMVRESSLSQTIDLEGEPAEIIRVVYDWLLYSVVLRASAHEPEKAQGPPLSLA